MVSKLFFVYGFLGIIPFSLGFLAYVLFESSELTNSEQTEQTCSE